MFTVYGQKQVIQVSVLLCVIWKYYTIYSKAVQGGKMKSTLKKKAFLNLIA